jgi:hypothetical protein
VKEGRLFGLDSGTLTPHRAIISAFGSYAVAAFNSKIPKPPLILSRR